MAGINKQMALQKISITVSEEAKLFLVDRGYDPRLGARPMRRIVQKAVENLIAKQMLSGVVAPGSVIQISLEQVQQMLGVQAQADQIASPPLPPPPVSQS